MGRMTSIYRCKYVTYLIPVAVILIFLILISTKFTLGACTPKPQGLISWYRAENNPDDALSTNNGTAVSMSYVSPAKVGDGFDPSGGGYIEVTDSASLRPNIITVAAWVKAASVGGLDYVLSKSYTGGVGSYAFYTNGGGLAFYVSNGGSFTLSPNAGSAIWGDGNFHLIVGVYDRSNVRLYVDGSEIGSGTAATGDIDYGTSFQSGNLIIGGFSTGGGFHWSGQIDEVDIYDRALSAGEITKLYSAGTDGKCLGTTAVDNVSFSALKTPQGDLVQWYTDNEVDNLGFNLYREENGERVQVNSSLIAGSALTGINLSTQNDYSLLVPFSQNYIYWLEAIDLNGSHSTYGPINTKISLNYKASILKSLDVYKSNLTQKERPTSWKNETSQVFSSLNTQEQISKSSVKISVKKSGWHKVNQSDLVAAGFPSQVDTQYLQLFVDGKEQAIQINKKNSSYSVEFYATDLDLLTTGTHTYWLSLGNQPGKRIKTLSPSLNRKSSEKNFSLTTSFEDRSIYFTGLLNGDKQNFFGPIVNSDSTSIPLDLHHIDPKAKTAQLEVSLQGFSIQPHEVEIKLNNTVIGKVNFSERELLSNKFQIYNLKEGNNIITLTSTGGKSDVSLVDRIQLTYPHTYVADENKLELTTSQSGVLSVKGFTNSHIRAIDLTESSQPKELLGNIESNSHHYSISINVPKHHNIVLFTDEKTLSPETIIKHKPSTLDEIKNGVDFVIITHRNFLQNLEPLKLARQNQGYSVALIDIEDLYDRFTYGTHTPDAIKEFLNWTKGWTVNPKYLLLAGGSSYDPRNYLGFGYKDFVPTKLIDSYLMETASDDWFVEGTNISVGRLPINTPEEATVIVSKLINYSPNNQEPKALLVADSKGTFDFETAIKKVAKFIPQSLSTNTIIRGHETTWRENLLANLNSGCTLVNYIGHGASDGWGGKFLQGIDIPSLSNRNKLPVFINMTCLNGFFQNPKNESLAKTLIQSPNGGAIAVFASSGMTAPDEQIILNETILSEIFENKVSLGDALRIAKTKASPNVRHTWILFGDPSLALNN